MFGSVVKVRIRKLSLCHFPISNLVAYVCLYLLHSEDFSKNITFGALVMQTYAINIFMLSHN